MKSRFCNKPSYPESAVHIFAENKPVQQHNEIQLDKITGELVEIQAIDESQIKAKKKISETGNLTYSIKPKIGAQFMLTANVNIEERLVNDLVGKIMKLKLVDN